MKYFLISLLFLCFVTQSLYAQDADVQKEIDEQVWKPFVHAYETADIATFRSIHTADVLRVNDQGLVTGDDYFAKMERGFTLRSKNNKVEIRLYFEQRFNAENIAYETGYYHLRITRPGGHVKNYAGRFHVMLTKEEGTWKIAQDYDTGSILEQKVSSWDFYTLPSVPD